MDSTLEPINVDFIKKEKIEEEEEEEECFAIPGIIESIKVDVDPIKEEKFEDEDIASCSSSNV